MRQSSSRFQPVWSTILVFGTPTAGAPAQAESLPALPALLPDAEDAGGATTRTARGEGSPTMASAASTFESPMATSGASDADHSPSPPGSS